MQRRALLLFASLAASAARAQSAYPARPVRVIAPQAPGGGVDLVGRIVADRLGKALGQGFVIDNQAGAGGSIAAQQAARAAPDGYTLMIGYVATHATNPAVRKVPYDALRDFTPIAMIGGTPNLLVCRPSLPVGNLAEFVAYAKAQPEKVNYGTSGKGTLNHLVMEQFKNAAGFQSLSVPYRSIGQAFTDLIGGQVQAIFPGLAAGLPHVRSGAVRPLAVTGARRHPLLPDVPTFNESGYAGFEGVTWYGIVGPARLPAAVTRLLNEEINRLLAQPDFRERLSSEALEPMPMSPAQFGDYMAAEIAHWTAVAQANNVTGD
ncbi:MULTISPECIES: Bug family tripartite tricarboxylate transporter substrate binding protein [Ramlibacter]|uniref:Tripartite tricarboxylate transporter substrate binding protein n=1 Tax=Ramlibacter pinisoli TaxID=2682844 RepID=A0A6N8IRS4_9BURK|nr:MULTISPECIES: tripartite tricarboxylate transporter substrate binding protein [Ramlibacter]MBA2964644.1 tripartite tricarboxylate transporter substrate binding protein [Ramlibacter sp. CGMCC 1.13660]MVQ29609.1 tripartite tricarboxylate transporter substrate binding protein [Ramlibacter pinisoli]